MTTNDLTPQIDFGATNTLVPGMLDEAFWRDYAISARRCGRAYEPAPGAAAPVDGGSAPDRKWAV